MGLRSSSPIRHWISSLRLKPGAVTGNYVSLYKKEADSSWKAVEDIATTSGAAAPAAPAAAAKAG
jgi:hypothetical protein